MLWFKCKIALQLVVLFWNSMSLLEHGTWGLQASSTPCLCFWLEVLLPDLLGWQQAASCSHWCRQEVVLGHIFPAMRDVFPEQRSIINPSSLASYLAQGRNGTWQTDPPPICLLSQTLTENSADLTTLTNSVTYGYEKSLDHFICSHMWKVDRNQKCQQASSPLLKQTIFPSIVLHWQTFIKLLNLGALPHKNLV